MGKNHGLNLHGAVRNRAAVVAVPLATIAAIAIAAVGAGACRRRTANPEIPVSAAHVEVSGCAEWTADQVCLVSAGATIRLWVDAPPSAVVTVIGADGGGVVSNLVNLPGGQRRDLLSSGPSRFQVSVADVATRSVADVRLGEDLRPAWLAEARAARVRGDLAAALAIVEPRIVAVKGDERAWALGLRARIANQQGKPAQAAEELESASAQHAENGRVSAAVDDQLAAAFMRAYQLYDYAGARRDLDSAETGAQRGHYADGRARVPYYRAVVAMLTGRRREALSGYARAEEAFERLGLAREARSARVARALELEYAGRWDDGIAVLRDVARLEETPDERAMCALNLGFGLLAIADRSAGRASADEARAVLGVAADTMASAWPNPMERAHTLALLAEAERLTGHPRDARTHAREAEALFGPRIAIGLVDALYVEGELLADMGVHADAVDTFRRAAAIARQLDQPNDVVRTALAEARSLRALARDTEAVVELAHAEDVADSAIGLAPLGEGRGSLADVYAPASAFHVELLLGLGKRDDALARAVHTRRRILRTVAAAERLATLPDDARTRWESAVTTYREERRRMEADASRAWTLSDHDRASAEAARRGAEVALRETLDTVLSSAPRADVADVMPLAPGDVELTYVPATKGWMLFVRTEKALRVARLPAGPVPTDASKLAAAFLTPAAAELAAAQRIRIRATGALAAVDFHALPWSGAPLVAHAPVDYVLDEGGPERDAAAAPSAVVVVGDPTGDLPRAFDEASTVASLWRAHDGTRVTTLLRREAGASALLGPLATADLLHYAGHATFRGREGWESVLPMAAESHLSVADVLSLPHPPRTVFLSACDAARSDPSLEASSSLGIAQAFLAAGSAFAIAPNREVPDATTASFARAVHEHLAAGASVPEAVRRAQLAPGSDEERAERFAFRVFASGR